MPEEKKPVEQVPVYKNPTVPEEKHYTFTPAPFEKRVAAWVGVVYMVMITLATTYLIATAKTLAGTAFLLLPPGAVGMAVIAIYRQKTGRNQQGRNFTLAMVILAIFAFALGIICGVPNLLSALGA